MALTSKVQGVWRPPFRVQLPLVCSRSRLARACLQWSARERIFRWLQGLLALTVSMVFLSLWMIRGLCQGHGLSVYEIDCLADLYCKIRRTKPLMEMNPRLATLLREYYLGCQLCWSSISQYLKGSVCSSRRYVMSIFCLHGSSGKQVPVDPYCLLWLEIASLVKYLATFLFFFYTQETIRHGQNWSI